MGEIVSGRYDANSGEMRSDKMVGRSVWLGRIAQVFGILIGLQAVLIFFGFPEEGLPLRIRTMVRREQRRIWD